MYIVTNKTQIKKGEGHRLVKRFDKIGKVEEMPGFEGLEVLVTEKLEDFDEVSIVTRWDSEASFKNWMKSKAFKDAHAHKGGRPDYIITNEIVYQNVLIVRNPVTLA